MTPRISVSMAALALVLAAGAAAVPAQAGTMTQGTTQEQVTVGRAVPADGSMTAPVPVSEPVAMTGTPANSSALGNWHGVEITPDMVWDAMHRQGLKPLNGFLVRYGDYLLADAVQGDKIVRVAYDPKIAMIRSVRPKVQTQ